MLSQAYMVLPSAMLSAWHPICHTPNNTSAICNWYSFCKHEIFHRLDEVMLFSMLKACLCLEIFHFTEPLRTLCFLEIPNSYYRNFSGKCYVQNMQNCTWCNVQKVKELPVPNCRMCPSLWDIETCANMVSVARGVQGRVTQPYAQANPIYAHKGRGVEQGIAGAKITLT